MLLQPGSPITPPHLPSLAYELSGGGDSSPWLPEVGAGRRPFPLRMKGKMGPALICQLPAPALPPLPRHPPATTFTHSQGTSPKITDLPSSHLRLKSSQLPVTLRIKFKPCLPSHYLPPYSLPPTNNQSHVASNIACQQALPLLYAGIPSTSLHLPTVARHQLPEAPLTTGSGDLSASSSSQQEPLGAEPGRADRSLLPWAPHGQQGP